MKKLLLLIIAFLPFIVQAQIITYSNGFEGAQSVFTTDPGSSWERGVPLMSRINTAHNGVKVWATDLDSNYQNNNTSPGSNYSNLYTPFFDIYPTDSVVLSFWHYIDVDSVLSMNSVKDGVNLSYRNSKNGVWILLGFMGDPFSTNWYNTQNAGVHLWFYEDSGWMFSKYVYRNNSHKDSLQFRFSLIHNVTSNQFHNNRNGWAIDDFKIDGYGKQHDVGVVRIDSPSDTLSGLNNDPIIVWVKNFANDTITAGPNLMYNFSVNGTKTLCYGFPTLGSTIYPGDSIQVSLSSTTPVQAGPLTFCVSSVLWGDTNATNDETCITLAYTNILGSDNTDFFLGQSMPNPARHKVIIPFSVKSDATVCFQMISPNGRIIVNEDIRAKTGDNKFEFDVSNIANGVYFYSIDYNGQKKTGKLLINK